MVRAIFCMGEVRSLFFLKKSSAIKVGNDSLHWPPRKYPPRARLSFHFSHIDDEDADKDLLSILVVDSPRLFSR